MRIGPIVFLWLLFFTLLVSCTDKKLPETTARDAGTPAYGDAIIIGSIGEPSTLVPILLLIPLPVILPH